MSFLMKIKIIIIIDITPTITNIIHNNIDSVVIHANMFEIKLITSDTRLFTLKNIFYSDQWFFCFFKENFFNFLY
jgi:hypothetical protein